MRIPDDMLAGRFLARSLIDSPTVASGAFVALGLSSIGWMTMLLTCRSLGFADGTIDHTGANLVGLRMMLTERGRAVALLGGG